MKKIHIHGITKKRGDHIYSSFLCLLQSITVVDRWELRGRCWIRCVLVELHLLNSWKMLKKHHDAPMEQLENETCFDVGRCFRRKRNKGPLWSSLLNHLWKP